MPTLSDARRGWRPLSLAGLCAAFLLAATMNAGGYRYGASDQAFYIPAILHHLDEALYPRDWTFLLAPQDRLNVFTAAIASAARLTGASLAQIFFALYLLGLLLLFAAGLALGSRLYRSRWTVLALAAALTLRHAVALGAVNTLEGYMHPRMIAFGAGALAVAACLAVRPLAAALLVAAALFFHPTTGFWFAVWVGVALVARGERVARPRLVAAVAAILLLAAGLAAWFILAGPLAPRFARMDDAWLSVLGAKRYLFPSQWPLDGWLPALLTPLAVALVYWRRRSLGLVSAAERGVAAGAALLFAGFLLSIPLTAARVALVVQAQVPRVLWLIDLLAVSYLVWYLGEGAPWTVRGQGTRSKRDPAYVLALVFVLLSIGRGAYVMFVEHRERPLVQLQLPATEWNDAMAWIAGHTDQKTSVLAPPGHAWMYGTSVRVAGRRDVFLEEAKDTAMAMYSRQAAVEVARRIQLLAGFDGLTAGRARELARQEGLNVLVTERELNLPLLHATGRFRVYELK